MRLLVRWCKKKDCVGHLIAGLDAACEKPVAEPEKDGQRRARSDPAGDSREREREREA